MPERRVILLPEAERNIRAIFSWLNERSPQGAIRWYGAFEHAVQRLEESADRFPRALESRHFEAEIREILFKTRRGQPYRMLFTIRGSDTHVLYVRGPGQDLLERES